MKRIEKIQLNLNEEPDFVVYINDIKYIRQDELNKLMLIIKQMETELKNLNEVKKIIR